MCPLWAKNVPEMYHDFCLQEQVFMKILGFSSKFLIFAPKKCHRDDLHKIAESLYLCGFRQFTEKGMWHMWQNAKKFCHA